MRFHCEEAGAGAHAVESEDRDAASAEVQVHESAIAISLQTHDARREPLEPILCITLVLIASPVHVHTRFDT